MTDYSTKTWLERCLSEYCLIVLYVVMCRALMTLLMTIDSFPNSVNFLRCRFDEPTLLQSKGRARGRGRGRRR